MLDQWRDRNDKEHRHFMTDERPFAPPPVMYNEPPPSTPTLASQSSSPPTITNLASHIITSTDKLFFIAYARGKAYRERHLVRVAFDDSISLSFRPLGRLVLS